MVGGGQTPPSGMDIDPSDAGEKGRPWRWSPVPSTASAITASSPPAPKSPATPGTGGPVPPPPRRSWKEVLSPPRAVSIPDSELRTQFIEFLQSYTIQGEQWPAYQSQLQSLCRGGSRLEINFDHLLDSLRQDRKHKKFLNLVIRIGNEANNSWLAPAVQKLGNGDSGKAHVTFVKKPRSISRLRDVLSDKSNPPARTVSVLCQRSTVYAATTRGRLGFRTPLLQLLSCFSHDCWFEDDFDIDDFLIIESEFCYIAQKVFSLVQLRKRSPNLTPDDESKIMAAAKARNLASLWNTMEEFFMKNGQLPIYFEALKHDMSNGTLELVKKSWFLTYLKYHFSLVSSMCRKTFTNESYQVCKTYSLGQFSSLKSVLLTAPSSEDWRVKIGRSKDYILNRCFWHGIDLDGDLEMTELIKSGQFENINTVEYVEARADTVEASLDYKRHLLQHLEEHFKKQMEIRKREEGAKTKGQLKATVQTIKIEDFDEIELFASSSLPQVEPHVLKHVFEKNMEDFDSLLSCYKAAAMHDKRDLPRN